MAKSRTKRNRMSEQFSAHPISLLKSPAWRALSLAARRFLDRLEIELASHGGNDNGQLPLTYDQLVDYGLHRHSVGPAIREAAALGMIEITEHGRGGNAESRRPSLYRVTYLHSRGPEPTHEWRAIQSPKDAGALAQAARKAKQRQFQRRRKKQIPSDGFCRVSVTETVTENEKSPVTETITTAVAETVTTSRLSEGWRSGKMAETFPWSLVGDPCALPQYGGGTGLRLPSCSALSRARSRAPQRAVARERAPTNETDVLAAKPPSTTTRNELEAIYARRTTGGANSVLGRPAGEVRR